MSEKIITRTLAEIKQEIETHIAEYNKAMTENDFAKMSSIETDLKQAEADYAQLKRDTVYSELRQMADPVVEAARRYGYEIIRHRTTREDGKMAGIEKYETRRAIDLVKFCSFCKLDTSWKYKVEKFNLLLACRAARELGYDQAKLKKFVAGWFLTDIANKEKMGGTPMSNAQCVKQLQSIVDAILPNKGYKVNNHDVFFLLQSHTDRDKKELHTLRAVKTQYLYNVILDVLNRVVTGDTHKIKPPKFKNDGVVRASIEEDEENKPEKAAPAKGKAAKKPAKDADTIVLDQPKPAVA